MQNERLRQIIREMQRHRFGRRAETLPEDQMLLGLEEVDQTVAGDEAAADQMVPAERAARAEKRRSNRGSLPEHLPRIEIVVDIDDKTCPAARASHSAITEQSTPACSSSIAALCLSTCGDTLLAVKRRATLVSDTNMLSEQRLDAVGTEPGPVHVGEQRCCSFP
jgi:hypothetical protein